MQFCRICYNLLPFDKLLDYPGYQATVHSAADLRQSAQQGCIYCKLLYKGLDILLESLWNDDYTVNIATYTKYPINVAYYEESGEIGDSPNERKKRYFQFYVSEGRCGPNSYCLVEGGFFLWLLPFPHQKQ